MIYSLTTFMASPGLHYPRTALRTRTGRQRMRLVLTLSGRRRAIRRAEVRSAVHRGHEIAISAVLANPLTYLAPVGSVIGRVAD